jgi:hypothetical protein
METVWAQETDSLNPKNGVLKLKTVLAKETECWHKKTDSLGARNRQSWCKKQTVLVQETDSLTARCKKTDSLTARCKKTDSLTARCKKNRQSYCKV